MKTRGCTGAVGATRTWLLLGTGMWWYLAFQCQTASSKVQKLPSDFLKCCVESAESTRREISSLFAANFEFKEASGNSWLPSVALRFLWVLFIAGELN